MGPPRLLVIDDEPAVRAIECECLSLLGYDVEAARDGADGLAQLARERFDLVVTDLRMPHLDGWDVLESAREIAPGMPVIILTGAAKDGIGSAPVPMASVCSRSPSISRS